MATWSRTYFENILWRNNSASLRVIVIRWKMGGSHVFLEKLNLFYFCCLLEICMYRMIAIQQIWIFSLCYLKNENKFFTLVNFASPVRWVFLRPSVRKSHYLFSPDSNDGAVSTSLFIFAKLTFQMLFQQFLGISRLH